MVYWNSFLKNVKELKGILRKVLNGDDFKKFLIISSSSSSCSCGSSSST